MCTLDIRENFFGEAVGKTFVKVVCSEKKAIEIYQTKINCSAHKKNTFQKNFAHTFFLHFKIPKVSKKVGFTCVPLLKIDIFVPQI